MPPATSPIGRVIRIRARPPPLRGQGFPSHGSNFEWAPSIFEMAPGLGGPRIFGGPLRQGRQVRQNPPPASTPHAGEHVQGERPAQQPGPVQTGCALLPRLLHRRGKGGALLLQPRLRPCLRERCAFSEDFASSGFSPLASAFSLASSTPPPAPASHWRQHPTGRPAPASSSRWCSSSTFNQNSPPL